MKSRWRLRLRLRYMCALKTFRREVLERERQIARAEEGKA